MVIDSKKSEVSINCENIEGMEVNKDDQLEITYFLPEGKVHTDNAKGKFVRKVDIMECCENNLILKTYSGIRNQVIQQHTDEKTFKSRLKEMKENYDTRQAKKPNLKNTIGKLF